MLRDTHSPLLGTAPLNDLPISIYVADPDGRFLFANREARAMLELPEDGSPAASFRDFLADPDEYARLVAAARDLSASAGAPGPARTSKEVVHLRVAGRDVFAEHYFRTLPEGADGLGPVNEVADLPGERFVGCMMDITDEHEAAQRAAALQRTVSALTFDIGQILHANTATLVMVNQTLLATGRALEPELEGDDEATRPEALAEDMSQRASQLAAALLRMLEAADPERRAQALPAERWEKLAQLVPSLEGFEEMILVPELRVAALRSVSSEVLRACRDLEPGNLPREVVRDALRAAQGLQRVTCFMDILSTRAAVIQMDTSLAALRDFITSEIRTDDPSARVPVAVLIRESISHLAEFAHAARVDVVWRNRDEDVHVFGNRRDLQRAITNLLHNAVKYSWKREGHDAPWIAIDVTESDSTVTIEVENWGVPVEQTEISQGLVFGMGYRGKRSKDRGRLGTGIGLTDSLRVAEAHDGTLTMSSRPARASSPDPDDRDYYRQPFLTRVRMTLPLSV